MYIATDHEQVGIFVPDRLCKYLFEFRHKLNKFTNKKIKFSKF